MGSKTSPRPHWKLREAVRHLRQGGLLAYPTEAVYGLGCDPAQAAAVLDLLALKQRPVEAGLILIASRFRQLKPFLGSLPRAREKQVRASWPGPVTWTWPASPAAPRWIRGDHASIAVRITAHPLAAALCKTFDGAIVSTSANRRGQRPARTALQVRLRFGERVRILHGNTSGRKNPSQIRDALTGRTLRAG